MLVAKLVDSANELRRQLCDYLAASVIFKQALALASEEDQPILFASLNLNIAVYNL